MTSSNFRQSRVLVSVRRSALVIVVVSASVLFLSATHLQAAPITYTFVDYPQYQNGYDITGTITTDGTLGAISADNIISAQVNLPFSASCSWFVGPGDLTATSSEIVEPIGDLFYIAAYDGYAQVAWNTNTTGIEDLYIGYIPNIRNGQTVGDTMAWGDSNNSAGGWAPLPPQFVPGQSWVIATTTPVPEPASLTLLISALLGFAGAFYLRRRRAKA